MSASGRTSESATRRIHQRIPIRTARDMDCPVSGLMEAMDGFTTVEALLQGRSETEKQATLDFLEVQAGEGRILWRDSWSPLRWCRSCNVPLLDTRCSRCGAPASGSIELKFPCNPRPVLPHDERIFKEAGLPWPLDHSLVVNVYRRPDFLGWELIQGGEVIGDVRMWEGQGRVRFEPTPAFHLERLRGTGRETVTLPMVAEANHAHSERVEQEAVDFIRSMCRSPFAVPVATFSGGKDSSVLAHLCHRTRLRMRIMQIDTGVDPSENRAYSDRFLAQFSRLKHQRLESRDIFWRALEKLGPPANDFQWCRTILKSSAPHRLGIFEQMGTLGFLRHLVPMRGVMIEGTRRREEEWRIELHRVVSIPEAPVETLDIRPIVDFTDLDVWLYIHRHQLEINPTYAQGRHQRLICMFCPDKDHEEYTRQKEAAPAEWHRFEEGLRQWQHHLGFPDEWVDEHLWRHEKPVSCRMQELGIGRRIDAIAARLDGVVEAEPMEAVEGRYRVRARIHGEFDFDLLTQWLGLWGRRISSGKDAESVFQVPEGTLRLQASGGLSVEGDHADTCRELADRARLFAGSFLNCIGCGLCRTVVPGIRIEKDIAIAGRRTRSGPQAAQDIVDICPDEWPGRPPISGLAAGLLMTPRPANGTKHLI